MPLIKNINAQVIGDSIDNRFDVALQQIGEAVIRTADPNTPKKTGRLRGSAHLTKAGARQVSVEWSEEYAPKQEAGISSKGTPIQNYTTEGTGAHFAQNAINQVAKGDEARIILDITMMDAL